jgi:hypothetical protein
MKKMKYIAVALLAGLMCVACTPKKEKLLRAYEDACQKGDLIEAMRVVGELEKEYGDAEVDSVFTEAEQTRFETASAVLEQKAAEQAMQQLGGAMQQMNNMGVNPYGALDEEEEDED